MFKGLTDFMDKQVEFNEMQVAENKYMNEQIETLIYICKTQHEMIIQLAETIERLQNSNVSKIGGLAN